MHDSFDLFQSHFAQNPELFSAEHFGRLVSELFDPEKLNSSHEVLLMVTDYD
jgi:hypothetical protein